MVIFVKMDPSFDLDKRKEGDGLCLEGSFFELGMRVCYFAEGSLTGVGDELRLD